MSMKDSKHQALEHASKGALVSVSVYLLVSALKLLAAFYFHSAALRADGLNNLTDILSSILIFIGLKFAMQPADQDHHFGHTKYESIASFVTSVVMF